MSNYYQNPSDPSDRYQPDMYGNVIDTWAVAESSANQQGVYPQQNTYVQPAAPLYASGSADTYQASSYGQQPEDTDVPLTGDDAAQDDDVDDAVAQAKAQQEGVIRRWEQKDQSAMKGRDESILIRAEFEQDYGISNNTSRAASFISIPFLKETLSQVRDSGDGTNWRGWLVEEETVYRDKNGKRTETVFKLVPPYMDEDTGSLITGRPIITDKEKTYLKSIRASAESYYYESCRD